MASRWPVKKLITNERIQAGDVIVGLAGFGKTSYESEYNSGIGSNGLTSARHDMLSNYYGKAYPESYNPVLDDSVAYIGSSRLTDTVTVEDGSQQTIGKLLLSPTRTFAPLMKVLLTKHFDDIHGMVHCSGGGQTKCMKYLPEPLTIIKDNLFEPPSIFKLIQESSGSSHREMYEVFNMGTRMEIYCSKEKAPVFIEEAEKLGIAARIVGRVEAGSQKLMIQQGDVEIVY